MQKAVCFGRFTREGGAAMKTYWASTSIVLSCFCMFLLPLSGLAQPFAKPLVSESKVWKGGSQGGVRLNSGGGDFGGGLRSDSWRNPAPPPYVRPSGPTDSRPWPNSPPPPPPPNRPWPPPPPPRQGNMLPPDWVNPPPPPERIPIYVSRPPPGIDYWDTGWPSDPVIVYLNSGRRLYQPRIHGHIAFVQIWSSYNQTWVTIGEHPSVW